MDQPKTPNKAIIGIIVIVLLVVAATAAIVVSGNNTIKETTDNTASTTSESEIGSSTSTPSSSSASTASSSVKDGSYSATGSYQTPGGQESIGVKVTLANGVITDATVTQNASGGEAEEYQSAFVSGYKSQVVGKKISEVNLSRVAGSSLTPIGFNDAIADIEKQAAA